MGQTCSHRLDSAVTGASTNQRGKRPLSSPMHTQEVVQDDITHEPRRKKMKVSSSPCEAASATSSVFKVYIATLSGETMCVDNILAGENLQTLYRAVAKRFEVPQAAVKLVLNGDAFKPQDTFRTLKDLGVYGGVVLSYYRLPILDANIGVRVLVEGAGTDAVNGIYTGKEGVLDSKVRGSVCFRKEGGNESISWWGASAIWPEGWYIEECHTHSAHYFISSDNMHALPMTNWSPYVATLYSKPGCEPMPILRQV